jgi:hypothetical protein
MGRRRTPYTRPSNPDPIRLTERDERILETINAFDGMMSLAQIDRLFFSGQGRSQPRSRMRALFCNHYINMPDEEDIHRVPFGETIYWLGERGAEVVAALHGETAKEFKWREQPRWSLIAHDLAVNDFRINVVEACETSPSLSLHCWIPESEFWAHPDSVTYKDQSGASQSRKVRPDGFFTVRRPAKGCPGKVEEFAFLLEIDMSTEDNPRFAREKVGPGAAYLKSDAYEQRFGLRYGRWLVVTTGRRRMNNMRNQTQRTAGRDERLFYFTTFDQLTPKSVLTAPIWFRPDEEWPMSAIPPADETAS